MQKPNDLHIIGVASMFIASKFEEIYALKFSTVYEKIGHKKLNKIDIIKKEADILNALNY